MNRLNAGGQGDNCIARYERNDMHGILTPVPLSPCAHSGITEAANRERPQMSRAEFVNC